MKENFIREIQDFVAKSPRNYIQESIAISPDYVGVKIFDAPIVAFGSAKDELFLAMQQAEAVGSHFRLPLSWNPLGETVISVFLPFTEEIIASNELDDDFPSALWLHGRIEGQECINSLGMYMQSYLQERGYQSIWPGGAEEFFTEEKPVGGYAFTSNWSERHVAFVCGLGTFGMNTGFITEKGSAGRFISVVTQCRFPITKRDYREIYEYCIKCALCVQRCPVHALSVEERKDYMACSDFLDVVREQVAPRYGCGKCYMRLPCTREKPRREKKH